MLAWILALLLLLAAWPWARWLADDVEDNVAVAAMDAHAREG